MFATPSATALPQNLPSITPGTKAPVHSSLTRHKPCFFIAPSPSRLKNLVKTTRKIGAIGIIAITAFAVLGLRAPPRLLGSKRPRSRLKTILIVVATGQRIGKIRTWAKLLVTIITRRSILQTSASSRTSQKTSIRLGNFHIDEWW